MLRNARAQNKFSFDENFSLSSLSDSFIIQDYLCNEIFENCFCFYFALPAASAVLSEQARRSETRSCRAKEKRTQRNFLPLDHQLIFYFNALECGRERHEKSARVDLLLFYHHIGFCFMISHGLCYLIDVEGK